MSWMFAMPGSTELRMTYHDAVAYARLTFDDYVWNSEHGNEEKASECKKQYDALLVAIPLLFGITDENQKMEFVFDCVRDYLPAD